MEQSSTLQSSKPTKAPRHGSHCTDERPHHEQSKSQANVITLKSMFQWYDEKENIQQNEQAVENTYKKHIKMSSRGSSDTTPMPLPATKPRTRAYSLQQKPTIRARSLV